MTKKRFYIPPGENKFYVQALLLSKVVERILSKRAGIFLSSRPQMERGNIVSFMKKMRINGLTKFDEKTFISYVNYFRKESDMDKGNAAGAVIVYIPETYVYRLMHKLDYPVEDETDISGLLDACGTFCNLVAGNFKNGLTQIGYQELVMSHFSSHENSVFNGIPFDNNEEEYFQISFEIEREKRIVVDLTLGDIGHEFEVKDWTFFEDE